MSQVANIACPHCITMESLGKFHTKNCKCGHHHAKHNYCGGCTVKDCRCDIYDQTEVFVSKIANVSLPIVTKKPLVSMKTFEIDLTQLEGQTKNTFTNDLIATQRRVDSLKEATKELRASRPTAGLTPD